VIYDLAVLPEFQRNGIGKELIKRCIEHFPDSEWLVGTVEKTAGYYEKIGFKIDQGVFLSIASKWF
jgi:predicted N-acetyltransferase YhbS